uniref:Putative acetyltransferase n=1 Tax=viral metagenome TaxID=1070528 RepID=A0A6M3L1K1_9ZZZZ
MKYLKIHFHDRFGPDLLFTHWMLYFKATSSLLARSKCAYVGKGVHFRPFVTLTNGRNVSIGDNVVLRPFTAIMAGDGDSSGDKISIGDNVLIGPNVWMSVNRHEFRDFSAPVMDQGYQLPLSIKIGKGAWIGTGAILLPGVEIGRNAAVGAGSVVSGYVEPYAVVAGNPAKPIKYEVKQPLCKECSQPLAYGRCITDWCSERWSFVMSGV